MICPACGDSERGRVLETRLLGKGVVLRRRRACECGHRWTTYEIGESAIRSVEKLVAHATRSAEAARGNATHGARPPTGSVPAPLSLVGGGVGGGLPSGSSPSASSPDPSRRSESVGSTRARATDYPAEFEAAWDATARTGSKFKALSAWKRHGKPSAPAIAAAWARWAGLERWKAGFVPHVSTWLNGRCWEQDPVEVRRDPVSAPTTRADKNAEARREYLARAQRSAL